MTLSCFRAMPRQGHLDRVKRIHGHPSKMRHATIKIRTDAPDCSNIPVKMHDWEHSCCADAKEEMPLDAPKLKGKSATMTSCFDANLCCDLVSGKSVAGILHQLNGTPIGLHSKFSQLLGRLHLVQSVSPREHALSKSLICASHFDTTECLSMGPLWCLVTTSRQLIQQPSLTPKCTSAGLHCPAIECDMQLQQASSMFITLLGRKIWPAF